MITLTVERNRINAYSQTTILKDSNGKVKAIFGSMLRQPRKGTKKIIINGFAYGLCWAGVN